MKSFNAFLVEQVIVNVILNFIIAYYLSSHLLTTLATIPLFAPIDDLLAPNISGDLFVGTFLMGLIITLITSVITRAKRDKTKQDLGVFFTSNVIKKLPHSIFKRAIIIGVVPMFLIALPIVITLSLLDIHHLNSYDYINYHAFYAATVAGLISYFSVSRTLAENPKKYFISSTETARSK
jgi:hypothetical protein